MTESEQANEGLRRVAVNLNRRGQAALTEITNTTAETQTEAINHALQLYADLLTKTTEREPGAKPGTVIVYLTDPDKPKETEQITYVFA